MQMFAIRPFSLRTCLYIRPEVIHIRFVEFLKILPVYHGCHVLLTFITLSLISMLFTLNALSLELLDFLWIPVILECISVQYLLNCPLSYLVNDPQAPDFCLKEKRNWYTTFSRKQHGNTNCSSLDIYKCIKIRQWDFAKFWQSAAGQHFAESGHLHSVTVVAPRNVQLNLMVLKKFNGIEKRSPENSRLYLISIFTTAENVSQSCL